MTRSTSPPSVSGTRLWTQSASFAVASPTVASASRVKATVRGVRSSPAVTLSSRRAFSSQRCSSLRTPPAPMASSEKSTISSSLGALSSPPPVSQRMTIFEGLAIG